ncbi:hypothetical protein [Paracoccus methylarcula]|uniref:hypothetical protein n=1 Tax=Paracoccus methylarcula TaxID=72022 RepID=UPI0014732E5A|nr:hypothetical protein [Paracoccus methylarcula]
MTYITSDAAPKSQGWLNNFGKAVAAFMRETSDRSLSVTEAPWPAQDRHEVK